MAEFLKKDARAMCGILDSFWLERRPLDHHGRPEAAAAVRAYLADPGRRKEVVLRGMRAARERASDDYRSCCETIGNQVVVRFVRPGEPDEIVERFTKMAREADAARSRAEALVLRLNVEELPAEVLAHDPVA